MKYSYKMIDFLGARHKIVELSNVKRDTWIHGLLFNISTLIFKNEHKGIWRENLIQFRSKTDIMMLIYSYIFLQTFVGFYSKL